MGKKTQKEKESPEDLGDLEQQVYKAFVAKGWIIPQTEEDVARAEAELAKGCEELPAELRDLYAVLKRSRRPRAGVLPLSPAECDETLMHLARAARAGREIPPEVEERMKRDRAAAEQEGGDVDEGS
jgi:hypothetical protein